MAISRRPISPFVGTLPPATERGFRTGGFAVPKDLTRADYRASWAKMVQLLGKMHKAGVPIVAGTDGAGIELVRELEIYVEAGFTPAEALATATMLPAKLVGQEEDRFHQGRQGGGPGARRRRSLEADRRSAADTNRDAGRQAAGCGCAAHRSGVFGKTEVVRARCPTCGNNAGRFSAPNLRSQFVISSL